MHGKLVTGHINIPRVAFQFLAAKTESCRGSYIMLQILGAVWDWQQLAPMYHQMVIVGRLIRLAYPSEFSLRLDGDCGIPPTGSVLLGPWVDHLRVRCVITSWKYSHPFPQARLKLIVAIHRADIPFDTRPDGQMYCPLCTKDSCPQLCIDNLQQSIQQHAARHALWRHAELLAEIRDMVDRYLYEIFWFDLI